MNRIERSPAPHAAVASGVVPHAAAAAAPRRRPAMIERVVAATGSLAAAALVMALVQTCEESVRKGEELRAVQRLASLSAPAETAVR